MQHAFAYKHKGGLADWLILNSILPQLCRQLPKVYDLCHTLQVLHVVLLKKTLQCENCMLNACDFGTAVFSLT